MKKALFAAIALGVVLGGTGMARADGAFDGFYVGGNVGGSVSGSDVRGTDLYGDGIAGGIVAGYGMAFEGVFVGAEANGAITNLETDAKGAKVSKNGSFGLAGRLGYVVTPATLGYALVGWERGGFEVDKGTAAGKQDQWANGLKLGGGVEQIVLDDVAVRGELSSTFWDKGDLRNVATHEIDAKVGVAYRF